MVWWIIQFGGGVDSNRVTLAIRETRRGKVHLQSLGIYNADASICTYISKTDETSEPSMLDIQL